MPMVTPEFMQSPPYPVTQWSLYGNFAPLGEQEYSQRQLAVASGIVFLVLIPLLIIIAYLAYRIYLRYLDSREGSWEYQKPASLLGRSLSPAETTFSSPTGGRSSTDSTYKRRHSYDKSYRTHEPLEGLPHTEFENKQIDPNEPEFEPTTPISPTPSSVVYSQLLRNSPDLVNAQKSNPSRLNYGSDDYAVPFKSAAQQSSVSPTYKLPQSTKLSAADRPRMSSQSSIVTDV